MFTMPAAAMEHVFGGYWRTRAYTNQDFSGNDAETLDYSVVDTRTRLYYTAIFHDNLKFVNKFEMDATWGDAGSYGDIGADGINFEVKNSYVDFNLGPINAKVGVQGAALARGFLFDDDFSGIVAGYKDDVVSFPLIWIKSYEGGKAHNKRDVDYFGLNPSFNLGAITINPFGLYAYSEKAKDWAKVNPNGTGELNMYYAGLNLDADMGPASLWLTGIYQGGELEKTPGSDATVDFKAWLAGAGLSLGFGPAEVHFEGFYATGDDNANDSDAETFWVPQGQSYYWAEIMGYGTFDNQVSNKAPADQIGNIMAGNVGVTIKPIPDLSVTVDGWYAALAEDMRIGDSEENELGIEVDLKITYQLVKGLKLDLVGAYLFAGDVTTMKAPNDADPYEIGTQLSLSF